MKKTLLNRDYNFRLLPLGTLLHWQHGRDEEDQDVVVLLETYDDGDLDVIVRGDTNPVNRWTVTSSELESGKVQLSLVAEC